MRIASLLPSATEIVCALGARDDLVARSHACDFPPGVEALPAVTEPRVDPAATGTRIHQAVEEAVRQAASLYLVDTAKLEEAAPDVVVTQDLCEVCAVSRADVEAALGTIARRPARLVSLDPKRLSDVWDDVRRVGRALGRDGETVARALEARITELADETRARPRRTLLALEWLEPPMVGGLWMEELVRCAGGEHLGPPAGAPAETPTREALAALDPFAVLLKPCGFSLERTLAEVARLGPHGLDALLPWTSWSAVKAGRVYAADGHALFNRPGPRLVESAVTVAALLHPELALPLPLPAARLRPDASAEPLA